MTYFKTTAILSLLATTVPVASFAAENLQSAFEEGKFYIDARYRYEFVDQAQFDKNAHASTLRTRAGYETGDFYDFSGTIEFENITEIGNDLYNNTLNGNTNRPVVADVESTHVNQAFLQYNGLPETRLRVGRERINLDNQRFIGSVGWRQNDQTFDVISALNTSLSDTELFYSYVDGVNRIFGNDSPVGDFDSQSHIAHLAYDGLKNHTLTAYSYLLDFKQDAPALSSNNFGGYLSGKLALNEDWALGYYGEYAHQTDAGDNPVDYQTHYLHLAPSLSYQSITATFGYELLASDNGVASFQTPLATLHKFNGFADVFLTTPANGLQDYYLDITYKMTGLERYISQLSTVILKGQYHLFYADEGSADYGQELDLHMRLPVDDHYYLETRYANYQADQFANDTQKLIIGLGITF